MCGIAGVIRFTPGSNFTSIAERLDAGLAHRGPDDRGRYVSPAADALLVHRRLAIIDPTSCGHQPMATPDGRHHIVFNGEIYNHRALRADLESSGETFHTNSDTDVVLRLIARRGVSALATVRGMFALAVWDNHARELTVTRDRFGIKPLYVAATTRQVGFASAVSALIDAGLSDGTIDAAGVLAFLRWGHIPAPLTWVRGVEALPAGTWRTWSADGTSRCGRFADARELWTGDPDPLTTAAAMIERARAALDDSVAAHLVADVPVGIFLSGGLDSAALTALARPRVSALHTYTVVVDEQAYSEAQGAALVAQHFDTTHHTLQVDAATVARQFDTTLHVMDQPTVDGFNTFAVAGAVAATGVKAVLSGVGGDEVFGGYPSFRRLPRAIRLSRMLGPAAPFAARIAATARPAWQSPRWAHFAASRGAPGEMYRALRGYMMPTELASIAGPALTLDASAMARVREVEESMLRPVASEVDVATAARLESTIYLQSQLLRDIDAFSMAHALEVRVPFIDAELVGAIWPDLARHPALLDKKSLLTRAVPNLPSGILGQPKRGFTLPFALWIDHGLKDAVYTGIEALARDGWIKHEAPAHLWDQWSKRHVHWNRVWGLGVLGRFLHAHAGTPR
ncbi:MAG TPA: asparagine synthase (glutamine-hydrolyzing) [Vicinamibacterales bacterium]|nr:asparagine synthase (glutamine-hydrolyzing) [Vicinamibacterales bacterium]